MSVTTANSSHRTEVTIVAGSLLPSRHCHVPCRVSHRCPLLMSSVLSVLITHTPCPPHLKPNDPFFSVTHIRVQKPVFSLRVGMRVGPGLFRPVPSPLVIYCCVRDDPTLRLGASMTIWFLAISNEFEQSLRMALLSEVCQDLNASVWLALCSPWLLRVVSLHDWGGLLPQMAASPMR